MKACQHVKCPKKKKEKKALLTPYVLFLSAQVRIGDEKIFWAYPGQISPSASSKRELPWLRRTFFSQTPLSMSIYGCSIFLPADAGDPHTLGRGRESSVVAVCGL